MLIKKGAKKLFELFLSKINIKNLFDFYSFLDCDEYLQNFVSFIDKKFEKEYLINIKKEDNGNQEIFENLIFTLIESEKLKKEGLDLLIKFMPNNDKGIEHAKKNLFNKNDEILFNAMKYLSLCQFEFDQEYLYSILFERSKLDKIGALILNHIKIDPKHIDRLFNMFFLDPFIYLDFLPKIIDEGYELTEEMQKELIKILSKTYDDTDREKIYNVLTNIELKNKKDFCLFIISNLNNLNMISKQLLIKLLEKVFINDFDVFVNLVQILGNESDIKIILEILKLLKKNKQNYYKIIFEWKNKKNLKKLIFRIYRLVAAEDSFYKELKEEFKNCEEFDPIIDFYNQN
ncbi:hypothetical protein GVAV_002971 [Gurleya vavrai]